MKKKRGILMAMTEGTASAGGNLVPDRLIGQKKQRKKKKKNYKGQSEYHG